MWYMKYKDKDQDIIFDPLAMKTPERYANQIISKRHHKLIIVENI